MKEFVGFMKVLFWISVAMFVVAGLLGGFHPAALVAGLAFLGLSYWIVTTAFKAAFRLIENSRPPPESR